MTTPEDRNKDRFKNESFAVLARSHFSTTQQQNSRRTAFALPI